MIRILFVCLGNICRSPAAEGVVRHLANQVEFKHIAFDSAGTGGWHQGDPPDTRMTRAAAARGIDLAAQRARQVVAEDFIRFDHILAMDRQNLADLEALAPPDAAATLGLFIPEAEVPDPYYGGEDGFERVLDMVEAGGRDLLDRLRG